MVLRNLPKLNTKAILALPVKKNEKNDFKRYMAMEIDNSIRYYSFTTQSKSKGNKCNLELRGIYRKWTSPGTHR